MNRVTVVAELSTNHGGDMCLVMHFVRAFAPYVDTIKIQSHRVRHLQPGDLQTDWMTRSELSDANHFKIRDACQNIGVEFLTTAFHADEVALVKALGCTRIKVGSGEAGNKPLADAILAANLQPIVSTGLICANRSVFWPHPYRQFLGCVTRYPSPGGIAYALLTNQQELSGWSDHSIGLDECKAAILAGARIIECHVQMPNQARPVRPFEKSVAEMANLRAFVEDDVTRFASRWQHA